MRALYECLENFTTGYRCGHEIDITLNSRLFTSRSCRSLPS